ncbi:MAG TPA: phosphate ABC transporter permease PstA [Candidatus Acidoferrales bacterium]|nr:phosphate ABC transporter permease PstA [Candidatus Acidoferrales bacterium]
MSLRGRWRKFVNAAMLGITALFAITTVSVLFFILGYLAYHGGKNVTWNFFTRLPAPVGEPGGGMANAIIGTAKLLFVALVIGAPVGIFSGVYLSEFGGKGPSFFVRYTADLLNGVPSIVIGIFAYAVIVMRAQHFSTLAGGFALGVMMIPIILRSTEQFLKAVPRPLREGAMALGSSKWRTVLTVVVPAASSGIITGVMLALARIAGETAPLLFTAFSDRYWSSGFNQPIASLPVMIYTYAIGPYKDWHEQAWTAGLVLLGLVFVLNVATRLVFVRKIAAFS